MPELPDWVAAIDGRGLWKNIGARILEFEPGRVLVEASLTEEAHGFPTGRGWIVHGGIVSAVADAALASAAGSLAEEGEVPTTSSLQVDFYRPAQLGRLLARATARHRTSRLAYCHATLEQEDGTVVAEARAVMYFVRPAAP
jgi:uncharacterized protein (TIGR00369 family)